MDAGITVSNGAVFWLDPLNGPAGIGADRTVVVAQLSTRSDAHPTAIINAQGKSTDGADDWTALGLAFTL